MLRKENELRKCRKQSEKQMERISREMENYFIRKYWSTDLREIMSRSSEFCTMLKLKLLSDLIHSSKILLDLHFFYLQIQK